MGRLRRPHGRTVAAMTFTALDLVLIAVLLAGFGLTAVLVLRQRNGADAVQGGVAELAGRLKQMAEGQAAAQTQLAERLQAQERALADAVEKRLQQLAGKVGESLDKSAKETSTTVTDLRIRLARIDEAQKTIAELSTQVVSLRDILNNKQARGAFGEVMLEDLVRQVLPPQAYAFQHPIGDGKRCDCLLILPNPPGPIVVDAKFPLEAWRAMGDAADDPQRKLAQRAFTVAITKHIIDIRDRYIVPGTTAEAALMFLPSEAIYAELHANFGELVSRSFQERVFIVSPTTLWATLNTIRAVLKDVQMREQAGVIQIEVGKLLEDVRRLDERVDKLQTHFGQAERDIRDIRTSADKVISRAERIKDVELGGTPELASAAELGALTGPKAAE
jgi:DNA recombination protein RmuC